MTFKKRGGRRIIVLPDGSHGHPMPAATIDNAMVKAIARAFRWQKLLESGTYSCLDEIAKAERIGPSFISRTIRLASLAPDILDSILDGRQPAQLTLKDLLVQFPVEWAKQRSLFGLKT
ncbi:MAG: LacI family transcriptional regulator [Dechloromonas sp.]|nr:LacI family transcriptional regulator [Dechloromonas sp.]